MSPSAARHSLNGHWQIARCDGEGTAPARWQHLGQRAPLAAWLRDQGQWQPSLPARDLDAEAWAWRLDFDRPQDLHEQAMLGLDGLATLCEVQLNGEPLLSSSNMFLAHRLAVGDRLQARGNRLLIQARPLSQALAERRPRPRWKVPMLEQQQLRWWRTTLLGRTPGWSPPAAPVGPWRDVWLGGPDALVPEQMHIESITDGRSARLQVRLPAQAGGHWQVRLNRDGREWTAALRQTGDGSLMAELLIDPVQLWWPHTHGEPALYGFSLHREREGTHTEWPLAPIGFRQLRWLCEAGDFALQVNGVPVFARGACWTPLDALRLHAEPSAYAPALAQLRAAGINMLRVSGCMVYESDAFHDACDAAGMLLWQDFMFANMDYPADDPAWLGQAEAEVRQQMARWQGRPSLALLCGNSELEQQAAMVGAARELWTPPFFHQTLPDWCAQALPQTPYWPSSAHGGALPFSPDSGTCSYYGVGAYQRPIEDARASGLRFASECLAFAHVPEPAGLERLPGGAALRNHHPAWKQHSPRDLGAGWDFEDVRDHYLQQVCGLDPTALRRQDFERYLMLSRVAMARVVEASFSRWRAADSRCRGALVWWLRDLMPGAGWGVLDDEGRPKSAWYAMARTLQPVAVLITDEGLNGLRLHMVNDTATPIAATLEVSVFRGNRCLERHARPVQLPARQVKPLAVAELLSHFSDLSWAYRFGPPTADLVQATLCDAQGAVIGRAHHLCGHWPQHSDDALALQARVRRLDARTLALTLQAERPALALQIDVPGHQAQDAYFDLAPGQARTVLLHSEGQSPRVLRGSVQAANARWPVTVQGFDALHMPAEPALLQALAPT